MVFWRKRDKGGDELERVLAAVRRAEVPEARLDPATRARILTEARSGRGDRRAETPFRSLFVPTSRLAFQAALPLVVLSVVAVVALTLDSGVVPVAPEGRPAPTQIEAMKVGSEVVFVIRNGERAHSLREASDPMGFGDELPARTVAGRFRDRLDENPGIVYYRID